MTPSRPRGRPEAPLSPPTTPLEQYGAAVRQYRHLHGHSPAAAADACGCTRSALSQIETGKLRPGADLAQAIDDVLGADGLLVDLYHASRPVSRREKERLEQARADAPPLVLDPADASDWVCDVTVPDGTLMAPGETFVKTWRVRNAGTVAWEGRYIMRQGPLAGPTLIATKRLTPVADTQPGDTLDVSVICRAPRIPGTMTARFKFADRWERLYFPNSMPDGIIATITVDENRTPRDA
ncbi:helix-turn-helix domain-containing protein [Skermania sp. ID1734]|uniref:NBR1-Ig-like domain-containing protein n=1 Tax=Skermania sp. ID1734 TaxID=2597516 RepID=UPI0011815A74|nr:helix-turn-helix domain-containing protein [Skermania sp. ID1734]